MPFFWVQPAYVLLPFPFADGDGERVGVFRLRVYSFFDRFFFGKPVTLRKVAGNLLIIIGIIVCLNR